MWTNIKKHVRFIFQSQKRSIFIDFVWFAWTSPQENGPICFQNPKAKVKKVPFTFTTQDRPLSLLFSSF